MERKKQPLWVWGALLIGGGVFANLVLTAMRPPGPLTQAQRAEMLGQGVATLAAIVTGVVLIVVHFVRSKRGGDG